MPLDRIIKAGVQAYNAVKTAPSPATDPEIPVPGRKKLSPPPQPNNESKANFIAETLKIPGRDVAAKRKRVIDEF